jgi:hypothetical protein
MKEKNAHIRKPKCAYMEERFCICTFWLLYMHIYGSQNAHIGKLYIWNRASVYVHFGFHKCAYTEAKMHIYESSLPYMRILASIYAHLQKEKMRIHGSQIRKEKMCIYGSSLPYIEIPYMHILASVNVHIQKPKCTYTKDLFRICAFWLPYMRIFSLHKCAYTEERFCICRFLLPYMRINARQNVHIQKLSSIYREQLERERTNSQTREERGSGGDLECQPF